MKVGDGTPGPGRPKGMQNKSTKLAKEAIAKAFDEIGGVDGLVEWAQKNDEHKKVFYGTIYPKLLPLEVDAKVAGEIVGRIVWQQPK